MVERWWNGVEHLAVLEVLLFKPQVMLDFVLGRVGTGPSGPEFVGGRV